MFPAQLAHFPQKATIITTDKSSWLTWILSSGIYILLTHCSMLKMVIFSIPSTFVFLSFSLFSDSCCSRKIHVREYCTKFGTFRKIGILPQFPSSHESGMPPVLYITLQFSHFKNGWVSGDRNWMSFLKTLEANQFLNPHFQWFIVVWFNSLLMN